MSFNLTSLPDRLATHVPSLLPGIVAVSIRTEELPTPAAGNLCDAIQGSPEQLPISEPTTRKFAVQFAQTHPRRIEPITQRRCGTTICRSARPYPVVAKSTQPSDPLTIDGVAQSAQIGGHLAPAIEGGAQELVINQTHQMPYTESRSCHIDHTPPLTDRSGQLFFSHSSSILSRPICS